MNYSTLLFRKNFSYKSKYVRVIVLA